jgi:multidrug efflux pump subunit AcrB
MTTIAAATGALPLALGWGLDAASRRPLGLALVVGLAIAQLITYFFTPVAYCYLEKMKGKGRSDSKYGAGARP